MMRWLGVAGVGLAVALSGCSASDPAPTQEPATADNPSTWTNTAITDENVSRAVERLPGIVHTAMEETGVPGVSVAVVRSDGVLFTRGFGVRDAGGTEEVDADTVFQLASLSKPIGATVVARAVSQGAVAWNDPITKYLPRFKLGDPYVTKNVTIGDLYAHRSGLPDHAGDLLEDLGFDRAQILRKLRQLPLGPFRDQYAYTNFGLTAAAEAVASAEKTPWAELSKELLYEPIGMDSTSSDYVDYVAAPNKAVTHQRSDESWVPGPPRDPDPQSPAGGVSSTANDMAKWLRLQLNSGEHDGESLIEPEALQPMWLPQSLSRPAKEAAARSSLYGFGMGNSVDGTGHVRFSHSGAFLLGAATAIDIIPGADLAIAVLTNGEPHGIPEAIAAQFVDIAEVGSVQQDWLAGFAQAFAPFYENPSKLADTESPEDPEPAGKASKYVGVYKNTYFGPAEVVKSEGSLFLLLGPDLQKYPLSHWSGNVFSFEPEGENAVGISAVTFKPNAGTMLIESLDENGLGTFKK